MQNSHIQKAPRPTLTEAIAGLLALASLIALFSAGLALLVVLA